MAQFVSQGASLPHRLPGPRDADEHGTTLRIAHRQAVFVGSHLKDGNVDAGRLLDQSDKITQWLQTQPMFRPEPLGGCTSLNLGVHDCCHRCQIVVGMACSSR